MRLIVHYAHLQHSLAASRKTRVLDNVLAWDQLSMPCGVQDGFNLSEAGFKRRLNPSYKTHA